MGYWQGEQYRTLPNAKNATKLGENSAATHLNGVEIEQAAENHMGHSVISG
jgi:hypothetical protein